MIVPTPYVMVAAKKIGAALFNAGVKDAFDFLMSTYPRCHVYNAAGQVFTNAAALALVTWDSEVFDTDSMHNNTTNPSRITFTTAGLYEVDGMVSFASSTYTVLTLQVNLNSGGASGTGILRTQLFDQGAGNAGPLRFWQFFNAGDYIEFFLQQTSGGNKTGATSPLGTRVFARMIATT